MNDQQLLSEKIKCKIRELSAKTNEPFYLYDSARIARNCLKFTSIPYFPKAIHFALMANSTPQFIRLIKQAGLKVFVNSLQHLKLVEELGFKGNEIVYAASAMNTSMMTQVSYSQAMVIMDSMGQFELWNSLFPEVGVGIRCNIGELVNPRKTLAGYFQGKESRLGFTVSGIKKLEGNPMVKGLHIYVGTNILDINYFLECYDQIIKLAAFFPQLQYLDFGGGFGLSERSSSQIDLTAYGLKVTQLMEQLSQKMGRAIKLILEPGRIIGGDAGFFVCQVVDIKQREDQRLIGVNASCVQFPRPLFYPDSAYHPVVILPHHKKKTSTKEFTSTIFGCSTYSRDFLARNILLPEINIGDLVVLCYAGSYCSAAHTKFLGFPEAVEYFL